MKVQKFQADEQRRILTALIVSSDVLSKIYHRLNGNRSPFPDRWSNLIARWCFDHFTKYGRAPRRGIESYFTKFAQSNQDTASAELIEKYLSGLSDDLKRAKGINADHLVDRASDFFEKVQLEKLSESIGQNLERNDIESARRIISEYHGINISSSRWIDLVEPDFLVESIRKKEDDQLITFPGALGDFFRHQLVRTAFVSFAGPDKRGKSFWLQEIVWRAMREKRKVLYYVLGDMPEEQIGQRFACRALHRPLYAGEVRKPTKIRHRDRHNPTAVSETHHYKGIGPARLRKVIKEILQKTSTESSRVRLKREGGLVISAGDIEKDVKDFSRKGWVPDVVVIDYADELAPEPGTQTMDKRHQINANWTVLRRIALDQHVLVVTATQTAATAYTAWLVRKSDFSEDKRKNAHVTGMVGINQTEDEKRQGIYRLNWVVSRIGAWSETKVVWTAGDLAISCPCVISSF